MSDYIPIPDKAELTIKSGCNFIKNRPVVSIILLVVAIIFIICLGFYKYFEYSYNNEISSLKEQISTLNQTILDNQNRYNQVKNDMQIEIEKERDLRLHGETRLSLLEPLTKAYFPNENQDKQISMLVDMFKSVITTIKNSFPEIDPLNFKEMQERIGELTVIKEKFEDMTSQRVLSEDLKNNLKNLFDVYPDLKNKVSIGVGAQTSSRESINLANQFASLFQEYGWTVSEKFIAEVEAGYIELVYPKSWTDTPFLLEFTTLLENDGFKIKSQIDPYINTLFYIGVGVK